eukprot:jgi/Mesvir1/27726/Mv07423-RA.1
MEHETGEDSDIATPKAESAMRNKYMEKQAGGAPFTNVRVSNLGNTSKSTPEGSDHSDDDIDDDDDEKYAVPSRMTLKHQSQALAELNKSGDAVKPAPKKKGPTPLKK